MLAGDGETYTSDLETSPSDVTDQAKRITNLGRALAAGVVPGAWLGGQVLKTQESGSGVQVGAAAWRARELAGNQHCALFRVAGECAARQWRIRFGPSLALGFYNERRKNGRVNSHSQCLRRRGRESARAPN